MITCLNPETLNKFRALAIKSVDQIEVGKTYYSNAYPESFTVTAILSKNDYYRLRDMSNHVKDEDIPNRWLEYDNSWGGKSYLSVRDRNIGASYNPWLIFDNENLAKAANEMIRLIDEKDEGPELDEGFEHYEHEVKE